jgi:DNA-binding transcriptional LysR family regulator
MTSFTVVNLSSVDLNLLLVLHAMLEDPSVARTARRLNVTSPAISNALARLRGVFDDPLFVRSGRGVVPTPRALELRPGLAAAIAELERLVERDAGDPANTTRTLTLALPDSEQVARLPGLVMALAGRMPRARLEVVSVDTLLSRGGLEAGGADAAVAPPQAAEGYRSAHLYDEEGVLVVRKGHPLLRKRSRARELFATLRHVDVHIALGTRGAGHGEAERELRANDIVRDVAVTVPTFVAAAMVASRTDLVAGLPRRIVQALRGTAPLVVLDQLSPPGLRLPLHLVWHERTEHDAVSRLFREVVADALA